MNPDTWTIPLHSQHGSPHPAVHRPVSLHGLSPPWSGTGTTPWRPYPPNGAETNRTQTTREITQWLTDNHQDLHRLGAAWVQADLSDNVAWQFHPPRPGPDGVNYAKGAATVNITMPDHQYAISAHIPWLLRLQPEARSVLTRQQEDMKMKRRVKGVTPSPQWHQADIKKVAKPTSTP